MMNTSDIDASVTKRVDEQTEVLSVTRANVTKHYLTAHALSDHEPLFSQLLPEIGRCAGTLYSQRVFGGHRFYDRVLAAQGKFDCPVTWLQGDTCSGKELSGMQFCSISGVETRPVLLDGESVGVVYEDEVATYCFLPGIIPEDLSAGREAQTQAVFERIERALQVVGMAFTDVARTWIYLDQLLEWYDEFNVVRTAFFDTRKVFDHMVPASTGIGAGNPAGAACLIDAFAIKPKSDAITVRAVPSPLQCAALDYRSSFSRAVEIDYPNLRELTISGTASIHPGGKTAHVDDIRKQVELTMQVVDALLKSRDLDWSDAVRGIAYFKTLEDLPVYEAVCAEMGLPRLPVALAHADVCRDDLLFELELDAAGVRGK
jgi:enamine deaminase RidA (YjgF/YER057c/UK114 family)